MYRARARKGIKHRRLIWQTIVDVEIVGRECVEVLSIKVFDSFDAGLHMRPHRGFPASSFATLTGAIDGGRVDVASTSSARSNPKNCGVEWEFAAGKEPPDYFDRWMISISCKWIDLKDKVRLDDIAYSDPS